MLQINWTQSAGLAGFGLAMVANWRAAMIASERRPWRGLSIFYAVLCVELVANTRHALMRDLIPAALNGFYAHRRPVQAIVLLAVLAIMALSALHVVRITRHRPRVAIAMTLALFVAFLFSVEIISLHQVDALLYRHAGPVLSIAWLWLACGLAATSVAIRAARPARAQGRGFRKRQSR